MTPLGAVVVTLVVWTISLIRSVRLRALVYSLPLPITLVLLTTRIPVAAGQLLGVLLLNVFVAVVAWVYARPRWHILAADLAGVASYVAGSWVLARIGHLPYAPVLAATAGWWVLLAGWRRFRPPDGAGRPSRSAADPPARDDRSPLGKLVVVAAGVLLMLGLGRLLGGMVVTFPYAGVLVVIETRRDLVEFRGHFARNSAGLLAFFAAYHALQDASRYAALAAGWAAFLACVGLLHLVQMRRLDRVAAVATRRRLREAARRPQPSDTEDQPK